MQVTVSAYIDIGHESLGQRVVLTNDVASTILRRVGVTDMPMLAGPVGDYLAGSQQHDQVIEVRKDAVEAVAKELARQLMIQIESKDTMNGYPVRIESADTGHS